MGFMWVYGLMMLFFFCFDLWACPFAGSACALLLRVGLYASSPHSLRSLRAFRSYPSRGYVRVHVRKHVR
jgi:hypothetical protein